MIVDLTPPPLLSSSSSPSPYTGPDSFNWFYVWTARHINFNSLCTNICLLIDLVRGICLRTPVCRSGPLFHLEHANKRKKNH